MKKEIQDIYILLRDCAIQSNFTVSQHEGYSVNKDLQFTQANQAIRNENIFTLVGYIRQAIALLLKSSASNTQAINTNEPSIRDEQEELGSGDEQEESDDRWRCRDWRVGDGDLHGEQRDGGWHDQQRQHL